MSWPRAQAAVSAVASKMSSFWRSAGNAFICRDGSLNLKLDIHPGLTFNIRDPKSNGEREEAENHIEPIPVQEAKDDIPF